MANPTTMLLTCGPCGATQPAIMINRVVETADSVKFATVLQAEPCAACGAWAWIHPLAMLLEEQDDDDADTP